MNVERTTSWHLALEPRRWQLSALNRWKSNRLHGVVEVVTGGGKTVLAQMCMLHFRRAFENGRIVILVPTLALVDQWFVSLSEDLNVAEHEIAVFSGESKPPEPRPVNLMTLNTARKKAPELAEVAPTFLVVDECHRIGSPMNAQGLAGDHAATLGLSATPERDYDNAFVELVVPALGPVIYTYDYNQARADGVIAPFEMINVSIRFGEEEQRQYDRLTRQLGKLVRARAQGEDVEHQLLATLRRRAKVSASAAMRVPMVVHLVEQHRSERTLIFHEDIQSAEEIRRRLVEKGRSVTIYHSKVGPALRRDNLRLFRNGAFDILVSCRALDEGVNVPETTVAVIASSTASARQRIQRLGRVLRPAPGKEKALIYTLYATDIEERRLAEEAHSLTSAESVRWMKGSLVKRG